MINKSYMNKFHCSVYLVITVHPNGIISFLLKQSDPSMTD